MRRRRLATELRRLRRAAGISLEDAAHHIDLRHSSLSRVETGQAAIKPLYVEALSRLYQVPDAEREALVQLARDAKVKGWWHAYSDVLSDQYSAYIGLESEARSVRNYQNMFVPGLLQTEDYARAIITAMDPDAAEDDIERRVAVRLTRQRRLTEKPRLEFWTIVDEAALRRPTGGDKVMLGQRLRLIEMARLPNVTLQVLPVEIGAHAGMGGPFSILEFPDPRDTDVGYVDCAAGELYLEEPEDVRRCDTLYNHLRASALSTEASAERIRALV